MARQLLGLADSPPIHSDLDPVNQGAAISSTPDNPPNLPPRPVSSDHLLPSPAVGTVGTDSVLVLDTPTPTAHPHANPDEIHFRSARRGELHLAVRAIMSGGGRPVDDRQVTEFLQQAPSRRIDLSLLWVAERRGRILWSILPVFSPGHTALLLQPPIPSSSSDRIAAGQLLDRLCGELAFRGVHLAQVLPDPADTALRSLLETSGFSVMAELIYLGGQPRRRFASPATPPGLKWIGYSNQTHELFKMTIAETYEQSLDCPELNGMRDMDDVLAGHKASGEFDPALWRLLCEVAADGVTIIEPLGVLLLSRIPAVGAVELVYLGLSPKARGKRLGDLLVRRALAGVIEAGMDRLTLAVDSRNAPALKIYYRNGLSRIGAKVAMMRDLRPPANAV